MLHRQKGCIIFECDGCGDTLDTDTDDFDTARAIARRDDWTTNKIGDDWLHYCPKCDK